MQLIGRDAELADVVRRVRERRLVTITGPGGIGKTALARAVADALSGEFELGSIMVDLTRVDRAEAVGEAVAGQLGYADFESLCNSPGDQPVLLLLDNCEHVLDAVAQAADAMLAACRMPTVLATSRSPLDLPDESVFSLGRLLTPPRDDTALDAPSLRLFVARAADHSVVVDERDVNLAAEVCRRLDGVPLAIEIAAARLRSCTLAELVEELAERPHELARPRFRGKPSHRSVADMVGSSIALAAPDEQRLFARLGVFAGPFTCAAAAAVAGDGDERTTRARLDSLVAASLVAADTSGDVARYRLLHPVRAVALDRLRASGELADTRTRLVDHVVAATVDVIRRSRRGWDGSIVADLLHLYDDIVEAARWSMQPDREAGGSAADRDRALLLVAVLWGVVHQAHTAEIAAIGEAALMRWPEPGPRSWGDAVATVATCRYLLGDPAGAIALASTSLADAAAASAACSLRRVIAQASRALGRITDACEWFADGARIAEERDQSGVAMELWVDHAVMVATMGDPARALEIIDRVRAEAIERDALVNAAWASACRGNVLLEIGDPRAPDAIDAAIEESRAIGYPAGLSFGFRARAAAQLARGEIAAAALTVLELIDGLQQRGGLNDLRMALDLAAVALKRCHRPEWVDLAATAAALPVTSIATPVDHPLFERARSEGRVLSIRDAYVICRRELGAIAAADTARATALPAEQHAGSDATAPVMEPSLVCEGDTWRLTWGGTSITLKASKGVDDLAELLAAPGREVSAVDLMGSVVVGSSEAELLDATARRQYEARIRELQADIDEAEAHHDLLRAERLQSEFDALVEQLTASVGLGGRARRTTNDAERARSAVTQRLRATVKRVAEHHPALGRHLTNSVVTGTFCTYRPDPPVRWHVTR